MKTTLPPSPSFTWRSKTVAPLRLFIGAHNFQNRVSRQHHSAQGQVLLPRQIMTFFTSPTISRSSSFSPSNHRATGIGSPANQVLRSPASRKKSNQAKFAVVGGFIFGASATTAIILTVQGMNHKDEPSPRQSADSYIPNTLDSPKENKNEVASRSSEVWTVSEAASTTESASIVPTTAPRLQGLKTIVESIPRLVTTHNESNGESDLDFMSAGLPTFLPSGLTDLPTKGEDGVPSTSVPTFSPTGLLPTDLPTQGQDDVIPIQKRSSEVGFRLRLFWDDGYFWQERRTETWWCMCCADNNKCKRNSKLQIDDCRNASRSTRFAVKRINENYQASDVHWRPCPCVSLLLIFPQFRVVNSNYCMQKMRGRSIRLKPCSNRNKLQQFKDYSPTEKFDLRPVRYPSRCLSQHHHPKQGEEIYAETCSKAHRHDTGYWIAY